LEFGLGIYDLINFIAYVAILKQKEFHTAQKYVGIPLIFVTLFHTRHGI